MKIIFLDVDGVLNCNSTEEYTSNGYIFVEDKFINRLKRIIDETDAKVVLSSDWRYDRDDPRYNQDFCELRDRLAEDNIHFYGFTPEINNKRGLEINTWLKMHPEVDSFVILDDRWDMEPNMDKLVRTRPYFGLTDRNVEETIKILNGE